MKRPEKIAPPRWATRFLSWYCNPRLLEEIEGDLLELFSVKCEEQGQAKASRNYIWNVIRFFRWSNIKRSKSAFYKSNDMVMFGNYIKVSWRNLFRNALPSTINIFGLSLAVGIAIVGFLYLDWQYSMDAFHSKSKRIYQVISSMDRNQALDEWSMTPLAMGPAMKSEIPSVEQQVRIEIESAILRNEDRVFRQRIHFVDNTFFNVFDFEVLRGYDDPLSGKNNIMISERIAEKFFGKYDPIGQELLLTVENADQVPFEVAAIFDNNLFKTSMVFDILIPFSNAESFGLLDPTSWAENVDATFVVLSDPGMESSVASIMSNYIQVQNDANDFYQITQYRLQPLETLSTYSYKIGNSIAFGNQPMGNLFIAIIGGILLILACINYMNISIGTVANRLKEIALRKVIGGGKRDIVKQFLFENMFFCAIALIVGTIIAKFLLLPGFNAQLPFDVPFQFSSNGLAITFFSGILLFTALVSGAYPALYVSRFTAIDIFRGKEKFGRKNWLSKTLVSVQFALAFWTILSGLIFTNTTRELRGKDWGYNKNNLVVIPIKKSNHFSGLQELFTQQPEVTSFTGSSQQVGIDQATTTVDINNEKKMAMLFNVGEGYLESMEFSLLAGRFFNADSETDRLESIVVNEEFVRMLDISDPIGHQIKENDQPFLIIGVVEDFHYDDFYAEVLPVVFHMVDEDQFKYVVAKTSHDNFNQVANLVESEWKKIEPDMPYEGIQQDEVFDGFFQNLTANNRLIIFYSIVALVLACMGLFGMVTFNTNRRLKEFSIHRVFGAGTGLITTKITFDFFWLLVIGLVIGAPLGFLSMQGLLQQIFPGSEPVNLIPVVIGVSLVLLTAFATVFTQILKVIRKNPAHTLRQ